MAPNEAFLAAVRALPSGTEKHRAIYDLFMSGMTRRDICAALDLTEGQVVAAIQWAYRQGLPRKGRGRAAWHEQIEGPGAGESQLAWPSYVYGVDEEPEQPVPWFTGHLELTGDFIVVGDVHVPTTDWALAERMLAVAQRHLSKPRQLLIAGDLLNGDAISRYPDRVQPISLRQELRAANRFLERMLMVFDEIYMFLGNHDVRLPYLLRGDLEISQFARLITEAADRITVSPYSHAFITSGGERWYIPHQAAYRQNKLSVGDELARMERCNVITTHQHHSAVGRDKSNKATIVDCGGLHEPDQAAYVALNPSTRPRPTKGFVLLRGGCATLLTPYSSMTDWGVWLPQADQREAGADGRRD